MAEPCIGTQLRRIEPRMSRDNAPLPHPCPGSEPGQHQLASTPPHSPRSVGTPGSALALAELRTQARVCPLQSGFPVTWLQFGPCRGQFSLHLLGNF